MSVNNLSIAVIMPVHEGQDRKVLKASLHSVLNATPPPTEVILVSDGERVAVPEALDVPRLIQLTSNEKRGPAVARNLGAGHATAEILCFIDSDVVVPPDLVTMIRREFQNEQVAAIFGSYDAEPFMPNFLSQYRNLLHHYVHQNSHEDAFTFWTGCGAIRREVFLEMGGFDGERYPHSSIEDIELGYRLKRAGYIIRLCKHIQVKHLKRWSASSMITVDFFYRALPWTQLLLEEKKMPSDLNLKLSDRLSTISICAMPISWLLGFWYPLLALFSAPLFAVFILLNYELYRFFYRHRGWRFTLRVIPWHGVFYIISGLAFIIGTAKHYFTQHEQKHGPDHRSGSRRTDRCLRIEQAGKK